MGSAHISVVFAGDSLSRAGHTSFAHAPLSRSPPPPPAAPTASATSRPTSLRRSSWCEKTHVCMNTHAHIGGHIDTSMRIKEARVQKHELTAPPKQRAFSSAAPPSNFPAPPLAPPPLRSPAADRAHGRVGRPRGRAAQRQQDHPPEQPVRRAGAEGRASAGGGGGGAAATAAGGEALRDHAATVECLSGGEGRAAMKMLRGRRSTNVASIIIALSFASSVFLLRAQNHHQQMPLSSSCAGGCGVRRRQRGDCARRT